ncbi:hypothetical protein [Succinimonas amylolytica]|uniref:hypothetical protein n=1 Tax=Succinimonas amylolytica TaxID=83769 RepID=UPI00039E41F4|nr:hypothetical protein [Succinimonas amylolytica]
MALNLRSNQLKIYEDHMKTVFDTIKVMVLKSYKELYDLLLTNNPRYRGYVCDWHNLRGW